MATLRELRKRLKSIRTTGQLAGAMRTVATAKYAKVSAVKYGFTRYASRLAEAELTAGSVPREDMPEASEKGKPVYVLMSGNRGLCGGYNHELFQFFTSIIKEEEEPLIVTCGRMARDFCSEKKLPVIREFPVSDVPSFGEARDASVFLTELFDKGFASEVIFISQRFYNMLRQKPEKLRFLPAEEGADEGPTGETLFIPDRETVVRELRPLTLAAKTYDVLLGVASGAQAATLMAMRSAYDNAETSSQSLETAINRMRQAQVTAEMIETQGF